jgi:hypothetical protein
VTELREPDLTGAQSKRVSRRGARLKAEREHRLYAERDLAARQEGS